MPVMVHEAQATVVIPLAPVGADRLSDGARAHRRAGVQRPPRRGPRFWPARQPAAARAPGDPAGGHDG